MTFADLLHGVETRDPFDGAAIVDDVTLRARRARPGCLFVACRLPWLMQADRVRKARQRRAAAVLLADDDPELTEMASMSGVIRVPNVNQAYAIACANLYGNAHRDLRLYAVTGTKGKTTTCYLIESALRGAGLRTGLITTTAYRTPTGEAAADLTTPEPYMLHRLLRRMRAEGVTDVVIEASSIGLAESRLHGVRMAGAVFTNLGTEHWQYHGGAEAYANAKRQLFDDPAMHASDRTSCVLNADDPVGRAFATTAAGVVVTYGLSSGDVRPSAFTTSVRGTQMRVGDLEIASALGGEHNVYNLLAALALTQTILGSAARAAEGLRAAAAPPGRLERIATSTAADVFVDYAHTPESVDAILRAAAADRGQRRCIVVVGCGGGSDKTKRPLMARAAIAGSDVCIITTDNPRDEDPQAIIADMLAGVDAAGMIAAGRLLVILDRRAAIERAIDLAQPSGIAFVLGKGHERTQEIAGQRLACDDREIAAAALRRYEDSRNSQPVSSEPTSASIASIPGMRR